MIMNVNSMTETETALRYPRPNAMFLWISFPVFSDNILLVRWRKK
jgi:hypothetical protein